MKILKMITTEYDVTFTHGGAKHVLSDFYARGGGYYTSREDNDGMMLQIHAPSIPRPSNQKFKGTIEEVEFTPLPIGDIYTANDPSGKAYSWRIIPAEYFPAIKLVDGIWIASMVNARGTQVTDDIPCSTEAVALQTLITEQGSPNDREFQMGCYSELHRYQWELDLEKRIDKLSL